MAKETSGERTTIAVDVDTYQQFSKVAKLLEIPIKDASEQAVQEWTKKNTPAARRKANQLLEPASASRD